MFDSSVSPEDFRPGGHVRGSTEIGNATWSDGLRVKKPTTAALACQRKNYEPKNAGQKGIFVKEPLINSKNFVRDEKKPKISGNFAKLIGLFPIYSAASAILRPFGSL